MTATHSPVPRPRRQPRHRFRRFMVLGLLFLLIMVPMSQSTSAAQTNPDNSCGIKNKNSQCNEFGSIIMEPKVEVKGEPVNVTATITLDTAYEEREVRWVLFSISNSTEGSSPVDIELVRFATAHDIIPVTRMDNPSSSELSLWVDILDVPVGETITLEVEAGSSERGAYSLETLVMPFDRGYAPIADRNGESISLYSFTLLAVNGATESGGGFGSGSLLDRAVPAAPITGILAIVGLAAFLGRRRL